MPAQFIALFAVGAISYCIGYVVGFGHGSSDGGPIMQWMVDGVNAQLASQPWRDGQSVFLSKSK